MYRGLTTFRCSHCGNVFKSHDIEYSCTALSVPQLCPSCGSIRTFPDDFINIYKMIWEEMEKQMKEHPDGIEYEEVDTEPDTAPTKQQPPMVIVGTTYFPPGTPLNLDDVEQNDQ